jgi:hypothetical protein
MSNDDKKYGLEFIDDKVLAQIVEAEIDENGKLESEEARIALYELSRRTPN